MGESVAVYDVTGPLQVPTLAICLGERTVAYGTHSNVALALQDGLAQAVLSRQLSGEQILVENLPFVPALPLSLRSSTIVRTIPTTPFNTYDASQAWSDLKDWLQKILKMNRWRVFAVPLDHDPVLHQIQPYIVHVLAARA